MSRPAGCCTTTRSGSGAFPTAWSSARTAGGSSSPRATRSRVWDAETGQLAGRPLHHPSSVRAGDLAPDGRRVVTQAKLGIYLWDRTTGDLLSRLAFSGGVFPKIDEVQPRFGADGLRLSLSDGTTTVAAEFPEFRTPEAGLAPLSELLTCQRLDEFGGAEYLDQGAILADPARYRRAWLTCAGGRKTRRLSPRRPIALEPGRRVTAPWQNDQPDSGRLWTWARKPYPIRRVDGDFPSER